MNRKCSAEQIKACIKRYSEGEKTEDIIKDVGVTKSTFYRWMKKYGPGTNQEGKKEFSLRQYRNLEQKVKRQESIIEILKTVECTVHDPLKVKLREMEKLYNQYSVHALCDAMNVDRGTFYNHMLRNQKENNSYAKRRDKLKDLIIDVYNEYNQILGAAKIAAVIRERGTKISVEMTRRLMREMGLISIRDGVKKVYESENLRYKNLVKQRFDVPKPNCVWVGDVTQFRYDNCTYYLSVVMDLFARRVVGFRIGTRNSTQLIKASLKMAYEARNPGKGMIFHSDRGSNYRSKTYCNYLKELDIKQSFSRAHMPYDNSVIESFFASMKREEVFRSKYHSVREMKASIAEYMRFYNELRPHENLKYKTPAQYEKEHTQICSKL